MSAPKRRELLSYTERRATCRLVKKALRWQPYRRGDAAPEDIAGEKLAVADGERHGAYFAETFYAELVLLVSTYPDDNAHAVLTILREAFWTHNWPRPK